MVYNDSQRFLRPDLRSSTRVAIETSGRDLRWDLVETEVNETRPTQPSKRTDFSMHSGGGIEFRKGNDGDDEMQGC